MTQVHANVNKAMKWAREVLKGKHPACKFIEQAIQRHFDDVKKAARKITHINFAQRRQRKS